MATQPVNTVTITNSNGLQSYHVTGGTSGTPVDISPGNSANVNLDTTHPVTITVSDDGLAGGPGEE